MGHENEEGEYQWPNTVFIPAQCTEKLTIESYSEHTIQMC